MLDAGYPFFGICFGNQLLGRALGFGTYKLKFGHRGINQPVKDLTTGKVEVTAHNHGFAVDAPIGETVDAPFDNGHFGKVFVSHIDLNDDVVEGLQCVDIPAFSVQYHPEAAAGPHDAAYLFDRFVDLMKTSKEGNRNAEAHRHQVRDGHRLRPDRDRSGGGVRLLRHPGLPRLREEGIASSSSTPTRPPS